MLWINRYTLVIENNGDFHFITGAAKNEIVIRPTGEGRKVLERLFSDSPVSREELINSFGERIVSELCGCGALVSEKPAEDDIYSRTDAYFSAYGMKDARKKLSEKDVIILGCGGIGTHMAWHFTALGIRSLTLLDFDGIEESNLNRQILFDKNDIGKQKAEVLKEKLSAVNDRINIKVIKERISSEERLEEILTASHYDLVVKALDSPAEFPIWLERVCRKHELTSISGITLRDNAMIGPTYIPGISKTGWSELTGYSGGSHKIYGTAPSLGAVLYHISDELAVEAVKLLTGCGTPKYNDKILFRNIITGEEHTLSRKMPSPETAEHHSSSEIFLSVIVTVLLTILGAFISPMLVTAPAAALALPFMLYKNKKDIVKMTFVTTTTYAVTMFLVCVFGGIFSTFAGNVFRSVILAVAAFGLLSIIILLFCSLNYAVCRLRKL